MKNIKGLILIVKLLRYAVVKNLNDKLLLKLINDAKHLKAVKVSLLKEKEQL